MKRICKVIVFCFLYISCIQGSYAQDLLRGKDLSTIKVDQLSDADIQKLRAQLTSNNITIDQAEKMALSKGMPQSEFVKLKIRLNATDRGNKVNEKLKPGGDIQTIDKLNNSTDSLDGINYKEKPAKPLIDPLIFGSELYTSVSPSFEPNLKLATPLNYILGPDDQIQLSVYGVQEYSGDLLVSAEGIISIPNVGQIKVAGMSIEAATQKMKSIMSNLAYPSLRSGGSKLSVTLGKIRSIRVNIIGSNRPGTLTLSSLATVFNALYISGGPGPFGSFREIELYRNNKLERKIDLYRFLLHGDQSDNVGLKDNDVIRIPAYKKRVELQGQFKRPGIFEVLSNESFKDILEFASGFTDTAYNSSLKVFQRNDKERKVMDLESASYSIYQPQSGDVFVATKILNRFQNRVRISGAVYRPDVYELKSGLRIADLIKKADGLKEDAYTGRGQVIRLEQDLTRSILSFDINKALSGDTSANFPLMREDEVLVSSIQDLRDSFKITIKGEIRFPGQYDYINNLTLKDIIILAGGFTDAAYKNIEIARLIKRDSVYSNDKRASVIINIELDASSLSSAGNVTLHAFDVITIRRKAGYTIPESITVSGEVQYPGPYALGSRGERVSSIIKRAGGFTPDANLAGAFLKRYKTDLEKEQSREVLKKLQKTIKDTSTTATATTNEILREYDKVPLDLNAIMLRPDSNEDLMLKLNDELYVPKLEGHVRISGEVLLATLVPYRQNATMRDYISEAGGFSTNALRKKTYVVYANGKAAITKRFLFFKFYPKILPGSELIVPKRAERKGASVGEVIGISSALASLAGVVVALLRL